MGRRQRTKGQTGEREVCHILSDFFGRAVVRNIGQARDGGLDVDLGVWGVEVKRRKSLKLLHGWMEQCRKAVKPGQIPVVVAREDDNEWLAVVRLSDLLDLAPEALYTAVHQKFASKPTDKES